MGKFQFSGNANNGISLTIQLSKIYKKNIFKQENWLIFSEDGSHKTLEKQRS